jgi:hypothetical protein
MSGNSIWRKSTRSQNGQNCVELRGSLDQVRDSKNAGGPTLRADLPALVRAIRTGQFG